MKRRTFLKSLAATGVATSLTGTGALTREANDTNFDGSITNRIRAVKTDTPEKIRGADSVHRFNGCLQL